MCPQPNATVFYFTKKIEFVFEGYNAWLQNEKPVFFSMSKDILIMFLL